MLRTSKAIALGVHPRTLYALHEAGRLQRVSRGLYRLAHLPEIGNPDLAIVAARIPQGIICLISALAIHKITTQIPHQVDIAVPRGTKQPRLDFPPIRVFRFSEPMFRAGVEAHRVDDVPVRVYGAAKTVADCFKFRNRIGIDVAVQALRLFRERKKAPMRELLNHARLCRVERVMMPYLEATSSFKPAAGETGGRHTTKTMTRDDGEAFKARWAMVGAAERDELRATSMDKKLRQLAALMASVAKLGWDEALAAEETEAREQWRRLRQAYGG